MKKLTCDECGRPSIKEIRDAGNYLHRFCKEHWEEHLAITGNEGKPYKM